MRNKKWIGLLLVIGLLLMLSGCPQKEAELPAGAPLVTRFRSIQVDHNLKVEGTVDLNLSDFDVDTTGAASIDADAASNFTVAGAGIDLTLESEAGRLVLKGDEAVADAVYIDADDAAGVGVTIATGDTTGLIITGGDVSVRNGTTGSVIFDMRDYADSATDDMAHASLTANCTNVTTGTEECDLVFATVRAGAVSTALTIDADGEMTLLSENQFELVNAATGSVDLVFQDFIDTTDDDMDHASLVANCSNTGSGTEECDLAISTVRAGAASTAINVDADAEMTLYSETQFELVNVAAGSVELIFQDFADTTDDDMDHGVISANCSNAGSGTEECDLSIATVRAGVASTALTIDADGAMTFLSENQFELVNAATGSVDLVFQDFIDTDDDDMDHASLVANCTGTGTGAEECDLAISTVRGGAASTAINIDADAEMTFYSETEIEMVNVASGNIDLIFQDFADSTDDDMNHAIVSVNCTDAGTGAEDCDLTISVAEAGAAPEARFTIDADGSVSVGGASNDAVILLPDVDVQIQNQASGDVTVDFRDYADTDDDDMAHVLMTANCTATGTGAEDCDFTIGVVEAGAAADTRIQIDADDGVDIGSANSANVVMISGSDTLTHDGDLTLSVDATGGNALAVNQFIGVPRIMNYGLGALPNGSTNTVITDIGDSETPATDWTAIDGDTTMTNDSTYYRQGTASLKMAVSVDGDADDGCTNTLAGGDQDWTDDEGFGFWFYADRTLTAGDLELVITDNPAGDTNFNLPAYSTANVWEWVEIDITTANANKDVISDLSFELSAAGAAVALSGAFNVYFDFIVKWDVAEEETLGNAILQDGVLSLTVIDVTSGGATCANLALYTDYFVHYQSGNDAVVMISDQSDTDKMGLALIAY